MTFTKIQAKKKSIAVLEQISSALRKGTYGVGAKLPTETEIATQIGVSRNAVREALSALQLLGIITSIPGNGTYVRRAIGEDLEAQALTLLGEAGSPYEALMAQLAFERGLFEQVIERLGAEDLEKLQELLGSMEHAMGAGDYHAFFAADRDFHLGIAKASHNRVIEQTMRTFLGLIERQLWRNLEAKDYFSEQNLRASLNEHRKIYKALSQRDVSSAKQKLEEHIQGVLRRWLR